MRQSCHSRYVGDGALYVHLARKGLGTSVVLRDSSTLGAPAPGGWTVGGNSDSSSVQSTVEGSASEPSSAHHVSRREGADLVTSGVEDSCDTRFRHSFVIHKYLLLLLSSSSSSSTSSFPSSKLAVC